MKVDINARRKALFTATLDLVVRDWSELGVLSLRRFDRVRFDAEDGTELLIHLATAKQGYGFKPGNSRRTLRSSSAKGRSTPPCWSSAC